MKYFSWAAIAVLIMSCHKNKDKAMPVADLAFSPALVMLLKVEHLGLVN